MSQLRRLGRRGIPLHSLAPPIPTHRLNCPAQRCAPAWREATARIASTTDRECVYGRPALGVSASQPRSIGTWSASISTALSSVPGASRGRMVKRNWESSEPAGLPGGLPVGALR